MKFKLIIALIVFSFSKAKSQTPPWQSALMTCTSTNGVNFSVASVFQDSSGVPTVIRIGTTNSDTLISAFQWFPAPTGNSHWDKVAVKFSYNGGTTWTAPTTCTFINLPVGNQRPFDPSLVKLPNGQIKMYFSDGVNAPPTGGIDTYSGLSDDGKTYTFEPTARFDDPTKHAIDPSVAIFGGTYYYNSWTGTNSDGAFRATSSNGTSFTTQAVSPYDGTHLWLGNYLVEGSNLKFYGCGMGMWVNSSSDGITWSTYTNIPIMGADPAVVKNKAGNYRMIYTGPPNATGINANIKDDQGITIFPSVFDDHIFILNTGKGGDRQLEIYDVAGKFVHGATLKKEFEINKIDLSFLSSGVYYCKIFNEASSVTRKIVKND